MQRIQTTDVSFCLSVLFLLANNGLIYRRRATSCNIHPGLIAHLLFAQCSFFMLFNYTAR